MGQDGEFEFLLREGRGYVLEIDATELGTPLRREVSALELPLHLEETVEFGTLCLSVAEWLAARTGQDFFCIGWEKEGWKFNR